MKNLLRAFFIFLLTFSFVYANESHALSQDIVENENVNNSLEDMFENNVGKIEEVNGKVTTIYEDLPDEFYVTSENEVSLNEPDVTPSCGSCIHKKYTKVSSWTQSSDYNFGWHPGFSGYNRASGYWFSSSSTVSFTASVSYGPVSVSIAKAGGSGYYVNADYNRWSRPAVHGKYIVTKYQVKEYDGAGRLIRTYYENKPSAKDTYVKIKYR
ncbi:hypothetical protein P4637_05690 [Halalkalibacterium halodurans]|uniref:BH3082 protein n=1 Tax=Halalkalibacterium halodurans (strain ATCC BAA-125 / DSM 18197 / FERM 7344 / JCM 9153 / C-125) TaxID=272558 RepID=Q9K8C4_HALH5|nr:hypothetical protein [Halalkalibacterium halodurans]MED4082066.1 hypothetical protein [Halalkalibacterium halodurans]MED4084356.1 hypothetical protein [Halalkalibacterium halodurans]MED4103665.1 hypothetical protein [Halalkalibacterium halodurans]MED4107632.1 hypothetical protein [Halalkalibacterium halodurans]MED4126491.1 hypothetical protein [Halalkalibacterium halodurans]